MIISCVSMIPKHTYNTDVTKKRSKSLPSEALKNHQKFGLYYERHQKYPHIFGSHSVIILKAENQ